MNKPNSYPSFGPVNELTCRENGLTPLSAMKSCRKEKRRLHFCADRICTIEEWSPLLKSIAEDRNLSEIIAYSRVRRFKRVKERLNSEEKVRKSRHRAEPVLYTNFVLRCFVEALSTCAKKSSAISSLTLDGIPLAKKYLNPLCDGLKCAQNLTALSLIRCRIRDAGCDLLLNGLVDNATISTLNLSSCCLTSRSSLPLSVFLRKRKTNLLQNAWKESFGQTCSKQAQGLHTLVLNHNRKLGDCGIRMLVDVLKEDFWVKTLNIRDCGLTKRGGEAVIELLETNSVITAMDMKENEVPQSILQNVSKILRRRHEKGERLSMGRRLVNAKAHFRKDNDQKSVKKDFHTNRRPRMAFKSTTKRKKSRRLKDLQLLSNPKKAEFDVVQLSARLSRVNCSNAKLLRGLINSRKVLTDIKTQRIRVEKAFSEMEPRIDELKNDIRDQDMLRSRILQESKLFGYINTVFTRLADHQIEGSVENKSLVIPEIIAGNQAWKIVSETDLPSPEITWRNNKDIRARGRPHCPRKKVRL